VVVFQTIEIERLSLEIESNRIKIRDFERQIFNAQNYEVQIRELTEKCFSYESERSKYLEENEKLNLICHQLYTELEEIKRRFAEVDLTMKDKYEMERARNAELLNEIERWKAGIWPRRRARPRSWMI
jgi:predicted RNase H-like nuclease (RuvC/YqgF family)